MRFLANTCALPWWSIWNGPSAPAVSSFIPSPPEFSAATRCRRNTSSTSAVRRAVRVTTFTSSSDAEASASGSNGDFWRRLSPFLWAGSGARPATITLAPFATAVWIDRSAPFKPATAGLVPCDRRWSVDGLRCPAVRCGAWPQERQVDFLGRCWTGFLERALAGSGRDVSRRLPQNCFDHATERVAAYSGT